MSYSRTDLIDGEPRWPDIPKVLRNGAEHMRLSTRALASAYYKLPDGQGQTYPGVYSDWLKEQIGDAFMTEWTRLTEEARQEAAEAEKKRG